MLDMVEASIGFVPLVVWMPRFFKSLERYPGHRAEDSSPRFWRKGFA
jgi:hypothetical protein